MDEITRLAVDARAGDTAAAAAFVRRTRPDVWRLCAHLVDTGAADDLTQDTYIRALGALGRFRADASAQSWLLSIARRACADAIRRRQRRRALLERLGHRERLRIVHRQAATTSAVELDAVMAGLDDDRRAAFVLTQVLGLPYAEAAAVCGCPVGTIRSRVARARADLVQALEPVDGSVGIGA